MDITKVISLIFISIIIGIGIGLELGLLASKKENQRILDDAMRIVKASKDKSFTCKYRNECAAYENDDLEADDDLS